jgi:hypothetical protein
MYLFLCQSFHSSLDRLLAAFSFKINHAIDSPYPHLARGFFLIALLELPFGPTFLPTPDITCRMLPPYLIPSSLAICTSLPDDTDSQRVRSAIGSAGGAIFPFCTGILSSAKEVKAMEPILVSVLGPYS